MVSWSQADVNAHEAKINAKSLTTSQEDQFATGEEGKLHREIESELKRRGLAYGHGDFGKKTLRTPGEPDFYICAPVGRMLLVEVKNKTGKLSDDQTIWRHLAERAGFTYHVIRSFESFLQLLNQKTQ